MRSPVNMLNLELKHFPMGRKDHISKTLFTGAMIVKYLIWIHNNEVLAAVVQ